MSDKQYHWHLLIKNHLGTFINAGFKNKCTEAKAMEILKDAQEGKKDEHGHRGSYESQYYFWSREWNPMVFPKDIYKNSIKMMVKAEDLDKL